MIINSSSDENIDDFFSKGEVVKNIPKAQDWLFLSGFQSKLAANNDINIKYVMESNHCREIIEQRHFYKTTISLKQRL